MTRESVIQTQIIKHLTKKGYLVVKIIQCNLNGWPDLQAMKDGQCYFIEVKRPGGKIQPLQKYRQKQITELGFQYIIASRIQDVKYLK